MRILRTLLFLFVLGTAGSAFAQTDVQCIDDATITFFNGTDDALLLCEENGDPLKFRFKISTSAMPFGYAVVDADGTIVFVSLGSRIDFSQFPPGDYRVYGFSWLGQFQAEVGQNLFTDQLASICYALTTNFVSINTAGAVGGTVSTEDGETEVNVCPGDGMDDIISFDSTATVGPSYTYVVTDENDVVLGIPAGDSQNFDGAGTGICRVYGLAYSGNLTVEVGDVLTDIIPSDGCYGLSDNYISVIREVPEGGTVSTEVGATEVNVCPGDGIADIISFDSTGVSNTPFTYVVTDENNIILGIPSGDMQNFDGAGTGTCRVWGLAYTGDLIAEVGDDAAAVDLSNDCFDLSDNFITVIRDVPDGGSVSTEDGATEVNVCPGDGIDDIIRFDSTGTSNTPFTYVVTDENNIILGIPSGDMQNFDGAGTGTCRVWGLAYTGVLTAQIGDDAAAVALSDDCFDLSDNFITVIRDQPEGGMVTLEDGSTEILICPNDGMADVLSFDSTGTSNTLYTYVITDENNIILGIPGGDMQDFDGAGLGVCRVWGLAYTGNITAMAGDDATAVALSDDCFDLSDNFISVIREVPDGGTVSTEDDETEVTICPGDGMDDIISFDSTSTTNTLYTYVVTNENNIILGFPGNDMQNFDGAGTGNCRVWGLAYTGILTAQVGDDVAAVALSDDCFDLSDNFINVIREVPNGGTVATETGETEVQICPGDGLADVISFDSTGTSNTPYTYVVTDENNIILGLPAGDMQDFDGAGIGVCRVWGLAYTGTLTAQAGDDAAAVALSDDCFDLSDNFITVIRETAEGGSIATISGNDEVLICPGDGNADIVTVTSVGANSSDFTFIITNEDNIILSLSTDNMIDFDGAPEGICRIWGLAYTGDLTAEPGDALGIDALSEGCNDLTDNFITVIRQIPEGGTVSTPDGETTVYTCPGDGMSDMVDFINAGASPNTPYLYLITDSDGLLIGASANTQSDFEGAGTGNCRVYGLALTGNLTVAPGDDVNAVDLSDDCFDLSDNFISIIREVPSGGLVSTEDGLTEVFTCPGDSLADIINFDSTGTSNTPYTYVVTDSDNVILGLVDGDSQDFEGAGEGICRVWGLAYTGELVAMPGDTATEIPLSDDCYRLSDNFVTVIRQNPDGGTVLFQDMMQQDTVIFCPQDSVPFQVFFDSLTTTLSTYAYILTDSSDIIRGAINGDVQDFGPVPPGTYRVRGLAYTGDLDFMAGDTLGTVDLSTGCFDVSDNFLTIISVVPEAGMITDADGSTEVIICAGDGIPDLVEFTVTNASFGTEYAYLVTDLDGFLVGILTEDSFDFDNSSIGDWRVYGLAYTGTLLPFPGDNIFDVELASECYDLTENFIFLDKSNVNGATIFGNGEDDTLYVCAEDGLPDVVAFINTSAATDADYAYVLTTESNTILQIITGNTLNFETTGFNTLRVWGISYTGSLTVGLGADVTTAELSDACFDLSTNFLTVVRDLPEGGSVQLPGGGTEMLICVGSMDDELEIENTSTSNSGYAYVITDEDNVIVGLEESLPIDFAAYAEGNYRVYGLSYTGTLTVEVGDNVTVNDLTDSCFELSDNFLTIERSPTLDGGTLSNILGGTTVYTCPGDDVSDLLVVQTTSQDTGYFYVITDDMGNVLIPMVQDSVIDFDDAAPGVCRIYGVSIIGQSLILAGNNLLEDELSDYCGALSANYITVVRQQPEGGTVSTDEGETEVTLVLNDDDSDEVFFENTGADLAQYVYLITDETDKILAVADGDSFDFADAGPGVCRVWGLSYTGELQVMPSDNIATDSLSNDCYDLSDNFITVNRVETLQDGPAPELFQAATLAMSIDGVVLAPNPVDRVLQVQFTLQQATPGVDIPTQIRITGADGQPISVRSLSARAGTNTESVDVTALPAGMYFLQVQSGEDMTTVRFIKR